MTIIGSASITIRADDKYFESDVRKAVNKIKNLSITLNADADISKASKKIRDLRHRINTVPAVIKIDADTKKAEEKLRKFLEKWVENDVSFTAKAFTGEANAKLRELTERYRANPATVTAAADTTMASAQLAFLARNRRTKLSIDIDPEISAALKGLFNTITGTLPIDKVKTSIAGVAANFEGLAVKGSAVVSVIGALSAAILTTAANILSVGQDITQAVGIIAAMPAVIFAVYFALKAHKLAWEGFSEAAHDNSEKANEALMKLPESAQHAALALRGLREEVQDSVQNAYWDEVGETFTEMVQVQFPSLKRGLTDIGAALGDVSGEVFATIRDLGDFNDVFDNVATGIRNIKDGIQPAIEGLATFVGVGSQRLPVLGKWLADIGERFGDFAAKAEANGDILRWIDTGAQRLQELGSVVVSTTRILGGLANAAKISGAPGLTEFANGAQRVADIVNGEPFQSRLVTVLEGARRGTDRMAEGFGNLMEFVGNSSDGLSHFLDIAGEIAGLTFDSIVTLFDGTGLGSGLYDALVGVREALKILEPGFRDFGTMIGDLGTISGQLLISMAPGLNQLAETLAGIVAELQDGILAAMPIFNEFIQAVIGIITGPLVALAGAIGDLLELFSQLPGGVQTVIMALGLLLALRPRLNRMFDGLATGAAKALPAVQTSVSNITTSFGKIGTAWGNVGRELSHGRALSGFVTNGQRIQTVAGSAAKAIGTTAGQGLRLAGQGLMGMLGGPWGAALAAGATAVALFAQEHAQAKAKVDTLKGSLDQMTGEFTGGSKKILAEDILDLDAGMWDDFNRLWYRNMEEIVEISEISMKDVTDALADPEGRDAYVANWQAIRDAAGAGTEVSKELAAAVGLSETALDGLSQTDLNEVVRQIEAAAGTAEEAEAQFNAVAEATGKNGIEAAALAANYEVLESKTSSVSEKQNAFKANLDILSDGMRTALDGQRNYAQSVLDTGTALADLAAQEGVVINTLTDASGAFDMTTQAGIQFYDTMRNAGDGILDNAVSVYDAALKNNATVEEASKAAIDSTLGPVEALRESLRGYDMTETQIQGVIEQMGLIPEDIQSALSLEGAEAAQQDIFFTAVAAQAFAEGNYTALLAAMPDAAKAQIEDATGLAGAFASGDYTAIMKALNDTPGGAVAALATLSSVTDGDYTAELESLNLTAPGVTAAQATIDTLRGAEVDAEVRNLAQGPVGAAQAIINSLKGKNVDARAVEKAEADVRRAQDLVNSMKGKNVDVRAVERAQAAVTAAQGAVNSVKGKTVAINATTNAEGVAATARNAIASVVGKTVDVVTNYIARGGAKSGPTNVTNFNADGGLYNGSGTRLFANGGIMGSVKAFAGGGVENHTAQIARGAWPVRIWAEPETGGEAYLPLSRSKRPQSLKIFEEVARIFGYGIFKQFADGGIMPATTTPSVVSSRYAASSPISIPTASRSASGVQPVVIVNPSQGLSEEQIGDAAAREWFWHHANR